MYIYIFACMCVCMCVCMNVCVYVCHLDSSTTNKEKQEQAGQHSSRPHYHYLALT